MDSSISIKEQEKNYEEVLDGIIKNEPVKNKYLPVGYHKMNTFPYFLIGKIVSKFEIEGTNKYLNGVGMLIGPSVVLTTARNLCVKCKEQNYHTKKVLFYPSINGDYKLFDCVKSMKTYISEEYEKNENLNSDWGLVYLNTAIGDSITSMLDIDKRSELKVEQGTNLYYYFTNLQNVNINKLLSQTNSEKISIVGYADYNENNKLMTNMKKKEQNEKENKEKDNNNKVINNNKAINGVDYIVFGNEEKNIEISIKDAQKEIMYESKGRVEKDNEYNNIRYKISTYKGQSGSPIFLRYKRISSKKGDYVYQFIGMHSQKGPDAPNEIKKDIIISIDNKKFKDESINRLEAMMVVQDMNHNVISTTFHNVKDNTNLNNVEMNNKEQNELSLCEYNIGTSLLGNVSSIISKFATDIQKESQEEIIKTKTDFILTKLLINNTVKLTGLFKKTIPVSLLFAYASQLFNVPETYLLLKDAGNYLGLSICNYNYDQDKKLSEIMEDPENCSSVSYEVKLNITKYGEVLANNIYGKFLETNDIEEKNLKKHMKKYIKPLFHMIFKEINEFENMPLTYGKLFKKVRKIILSKLEINDQGKN